MTLKFNTEECSSKDTSISQISTGTKYSVFRNIKMRSTYNTCSKGNTPSHSSLFAGLSKYGWKSCSEFRIANSILMLRQQQITKGDTPFKDKIPVFLNSSYSYTCTQKMVSRAL